MSLPQNPFSPENSEAGSPQKPSTQPLEGSRHIQEGLLISVFPDVCMTPCGGSSVPIPYNLYAYQSDDANTTTTVNFTAQRTHTANSMITKCYGDEKGRDGGIFSGTHNSICEPMTWSQTVRNEGYGVVRHQDFWWMNNRNTIGRLAYTDDVNGYKSILLAQSLTGTMSDAPTLPQIKVPDPVDVAKSMMEGGAKLAGRAGPAGPFAGAAAYTGYATGTYATQKLIGLDWYYFARPADTIGTRSGILPFSGVPYTLDITSGVPNTAVAGGGSQGGFTPEQKKAFDAAFAAALASVLAQMNVRVTGSESDCSAYECGDPTSKSKFKGGSYRCLSNKKGGSVVGDKITPHHTPADKYSSVERSIGPAVEMQETPDHMATASWGSKVKGPSYALQRTALDNGLYSVALALDYWDVKRVAALTGDPHKYDEGLRQMLLYTACLKLRGYIKGW